MPSPRPMAASGGEPKWSSSVRMLPGELPTWSATAAATARRRCRQPKRLADRHRRRAAARPAATGRRWRRGEHDHPDAERQVRHVGLGAVRRRDDQWHEGDGVAAKHAPRREQHDDPRHDGQVRVPRLGQRVLAVAAEHEGEQGGDRRARPTPPETAHHQPQPGADGEQVDDHRPDLHRPRRLAEDAVRRREQVEAQRTGVAALRRVRRRCGRAARSAACGW